MVHRKVDYEAAAGRDDGEVLLLIAEQFAADRAATAQLRSAVQALAEAINAYDGELRDHDRRLDEATRLRFDDNKLHQGAVLHVRTGVEAMEQAIKVQGKQGFEALAACRHPPGAKQLRRAPYDRDARCSARQHAPLNPQPKPCEPKREK